MPWGERTIPLIPSCNYSTLGTVLCPFPLSPKLQVAEAGQGHPSSVGLSPCTKLGVCLKWEGLKAAGRRVKHQGGRRALPVPVPAANDLCASAGSAVMATAIKYDGSWSRATVVFVSPLQGVWALAPSFPWDPKRNWSFSVLVQEPWLHS